MTLRPAPGSARHVALDYEIAQEQASALGRLGRALEAALAALAAFDGVAPYHRDLTQGVAQGIDQDAAGGPRPAGSGPGAPNRMAAENRETRARLVQEASYALWCFIVQRESCGLRDPRPVIRDYRVPAEVHNRMGIVITHQGRRRSTPSP
jgi:hypothetical protein